MPSSSISSILDSLHDLAEPIHVTGLEGSSAAFLAREALKSPRFSRILILTPQSERIFEWVANLQSMIDCGTNPSSHELYGLPGWDKSPVSAITPSLQTRLERLRTVSKTLISGRSSVVVSTLDATLQTALPLRWLEENHVRLKPDVSIDSRESLVQRLLNWGYARVDTVEDPGTFAVRGEIIDVFCPLYPSPLRIELFDDVVERLRSFDPKTQVSHATEELRDALIVPSRETFIPASAIPRLREEIKSICDTAGISRSVRDPVMESIQPGVYSDHSEFWGPLYWDSHHDFIELYRPDLIIMDDPLGCEQGWDELRAEFQNGYTTALSEGRILAPLEKLYPRSTRGMSDWTRGSKALFLDRIQLADLTVTPGADEETDDATQEKRIKTHHSASTKSNSGFLDSNSKDHADALFASLKQWIQKKYQTTICASTSSQLERIKYLMDHRSVPYTLGATEEPGSIRLIESSLGEGFRWPKEKIALLTDREIFGNSKKKSARNRDKKHEALSSAAEWSELQSLTQLEIGDPIVHRDHGIGLYQGIVRLKALGTENDFLQIEYAGRDKLYLPVYRVNVIQKHMGATADAVVLDKLGAKHFEKEKEKARESAKKIAFDLIQLYAERSIRPGIRVSGTDDSYRDFEASFAFEETPDQLKAIDAILGDLSSGKVMDRLICGDVGYGKTEVAIRAAYKMVSEGYQVAVLVPTTILAQQHENSFRARFKDYPIRVESVSRFKTAQTQKSIMEDVNAGKVDVLIGTHRLLSKDVQFKKLGLIIIDEEHRFGVEHKEKLKTFRVNTHVLTLSATPIPRTLHMALSGIREISLITTPPINRLPVRTYLAKFDEEMIRKAVEFELNRGGQVFFVHNRVQSIHEIAKTILELVPSAKVVVGHAQMGEKELEQVMLDFYQKRANVLVSTTIIESGIDVPTANTMIIDRADRFGLAQLYQIRGRVGRGQNRAYAYLLLPREGMISDDAKKRLEVIQKFVELGSGFSVASHDLEIRGGGDLLGPQQSGHIKAIGFELYLELLDEAVREIQGKPPTPEEQYREPEIKVPYSAFLPDQYVPDTHQRLALYRRLSSSSQELEVDQIEVELQDRFGKLPTEAQNLLWLIRIKIALKKLRVDALTQGPEKIVLVPGAGSLLDPVRAIALVSSKPKLYQLTPESKFIANVKIVAIQDLYFALLSLLKELQSPGPRS